MCLKMKLRCFSPFDVGGSFSSTTACFSETWQNGPFFFKPATTYKAAVTTQEPRCDQYHYMLDTEFFCLYIQFVATVVSHFNGVGVRINN